MVTFGPLVGLQLLNKSEPSENSKFSIFAHTSPAEWEYTEMSTASE